MRSPVTSTYRFQLHSGFTFAHAIEQLDYVADLGVSHVYCSPILAAVPGSMHGYDVVDHTRINPELGSRDGFIALANAAHERGLAVVVDVVPNHMAFVAPASNNRPLWQYLAGGAQASTADWFDIDTSVEDGKIVLPVLGDDLDKVLANGQIEVIDDDELGRIVRYYDHFFPLAERPERTDLSAPELRELLDAQHYRLVSWRQDDRLNYRRFFDVNGLIAVRVEDEKVFEATHALLLELHEAGHIDAFRIDHPDGLADPAGYLQMLADHCRPGTPIWVEKILEPGEKLPSEWQTAGTTGYDALAAITGALADDQAKPVWHDVFKTALPADQSADPEIATQDAKRYIVRNNLRAEVLRLTRLAHRVRSDFTVEQLAGAIEEVLVHAPVYRAYLRWGEPMSEESSRHLDEAFEHALAAGNSRGVDLAAPLAAVEMLARGDVDVATDEFDDVQPAVRDFATRFQQTWGPAMAKSVEDTLFYRWTEMIAINEVGSGIELVDARGVDRFHEWAEHTATAWPLAMTTLSTHDTKRSEDVRANLLAMSGDSDGWRRTSEAAFALADMLGLDRPMAHLVWQTIAGMGVDVDIDRLHEYLTKAMREAKVFTAWIDGDEQYEALVYEFADAILLAQEPSPASGETAATLNARAELAWQLRREIVALRENNADAMVLTGNVQKAIQLLAPGVPDTYQGSEGPTLSLVDPDNRRPVDFTRLRDGLHRPGSRGALVQRLLAADVQAAAGPGGAYEALETTDAKLLAFLRTERPGAWQRVKDRVKETVTHSSPKPARVAFVGARAATRALADAQLGEAVVHIPQGRWRNAFTDDVVNVPVDGVRVAELGQHAYGHLHVLIEEQS